MSPRTQLQRGIWDGGGSTIFLAGVRLCRPLVQLCPVPKISRFTMPCSHVINLLMISPVPRNGAGGGDGVGEGAGGGHPHLHRWVHPQTRCLWLQGNPPCDAVLCCRQFLKHPDYSELIIEFACSCCEMLGQTFVKFQMSRILDNWGENVDFLLKYLTCWSQIAQYWVLQLNIFF